MPSSIRPQDALQLYTILSTPNNGSDNLIELVNILGKCMGISYDLERGRGGHSGGTYWVTPNGGNRVQLFTYTTKSYTQEKVAELKNALRPIAVSLTDDNLRRAFIFADQGSTGSITAASFVQKSAATV